MNCDKPSLSRYKNRSIRCRCPGCCAANTAYMASYRRDRMLTRATALVNTARCRRELARLRAAGVTYQAVAELADIPLMQVYRIATGQTRRCHKHVADALLAVCLAD